MFLLESENATDREEIDDVVTQFEALQDRNLEYKLEVAICKEKIPWPEPPSRVVFRRREN